VKIEAAVLHLLTIETIEKLTDEDALMLLNMKWVKPIVAVMNELPQEVIRKLVAKVAALAEKYARDLC
jgi:type I restriction enzyme M protein